MVLITTPIYRVPIMCYEPGKVYTKSNIHNNLRENYYYAQLSMSKLELRNMFEVRKLIISLAIYSARDK